MKIHKKNALPKGGAFFVVRGEGRGVLVIWRLAVELGVEVSDDFFAGFAVHFGDDFWAANDYFLGPSGIQDVES